MNYVISYTHSLGNASLRCYDWEVIAVIKNLTQMALQGHSFSNLTLKRI